MKYIITRINRILGVSGAEVLSEVPAAEWANPQMTEAEILARLQEPENEKYQGNVVATLVGGSMVRYVAGTETREQFLSNDLLMSLDDAVSEASEICYDEIDNAIDSLAQLKMLLQRREYH